MSEYRFSKKEADFLDELAPFNENPVRYVDADVLDQMLKDAKRKKIVIPKQLVKKIKSEIDKYGVFDFVLVE